MTNIARISNAIEMGDERAVDKLILTVYQELRHLIAHKLQSEATLTPDLMLGKQFHRIML